MHDFYIMTAYLIIKYNKVYYPPSVLLTYVGPLVLWLQRLLATYTHMQVLRAFIITCLIASMISNL